MKTFTPEEFRAERLNKCYSLVELASILGTSSGVIQKYERRLCKSTQETLSRLQELFDLPVNPNRIYDPRLYKPRNFSPERLKRIRTNAGLSKNKLALCVGISSQILTRYEEGQSIPSYELWERILIAVRIRCRKPVYYCSATRHNLNDKNNSPISDTPYIKPSFSFIGGKCYSIFTHNRFNNDQNMEKCFTFRYVGKRGIHHCFIEANHSWSRTFTDAQLIGKRIQEVNT